MMQCSPSPTRYRFFSFLETFLKADFNVIAFLELYQFNSSVNYTLRLNGVILTINWLEDQL